MKTDTYKLIILLMLMFATINCSNLSSHNNPNRKFYIGRFRLDVQRSDLNYYNKDASSANELVLELKENDSFYFSKSLPFLRSTAGKWIMKSKDNLYTAYLLYKKSEFGQIEDVVYIVNGVDLKIANPRGNVAIGKESKKFAESLIFKRMD